MCGRRDRFANGADVSALLEEIACRHPSRRGLLTRMAVAVDHAYASHQTVLCEGAEVALIPPVGGGASDDDHEASCLDADKRDHLIAQSEDGRFQLWEKLLDVEGAVSLVTGEFAGAIVIVVCSAHRQAGFAACSYAIERLKETVPIWKKEIFTDGSEWTG